MFRFVVLSAITFCVAYLLYVFPVLALVSLFQGGPVFGVWALPATALVFVLLRLYLATSTTNRMLKAFVYYGMGIGFLAGMTLSVLLLVRSVRHFRWSSAGNGCACNYCRAGTIAIRNANGFVTRHISLRRTALTGH